jgi:hypothetical protein
MEGKISLGNLVNSLIKKFDSITKMKCPECKSLDYSREFLFKGNSLPYVPPTPFPTRSIPLPPLYMYHCNECDKEWYA